MIIVLAALDSSYLRSVSASFVPHANHVFSNSIVNHFVHACTSFTIFGSVYSHSLNAPSPSRAPGSWYYCASFSLQLAEDVKTHGPVLAVLMVIGGLDTRPRLGGLVQHEELGNGTIAKIEARSKVVVLFHGCKSAKLCTLGSIRPVSTKLG